MIRNEKHNLTARLASCANDIKAAQRLRFQVFYQEMSAVPDSQMQKTQLDMDVFDSYCDHILIIDDNPSAHHNSILVDDGELLGTYRVLSQTQAHQNCGFYTQNEFDIAALIKQKPHLNFLELGRSCVARHARSKPVLELLWQMIWRHMRLNKVDVLFGCASMDGVHYQSNDVNLRYLKQSHEAPKQWRVKPIESSHQFEISDQSLNSIQRQQALAQLPSLIKSYLKVGAFIASNAVIDTQFNVTDILVILPVRNISKKYRQRFAK